MGLFKSKTRSVVGLDIEPGFLAAVEFTNNGKAMLTRAATTSLGPGLFHEGEVVDVEGLADRLRSFFRDHDLPKRVRLGVASQKIAVRVIELPIIDNEQELDAAIRFQAQDELPMPLEQAVLDHRLLERVEDPEGGRMRVLIVAARRASVDHLLAAARRAGLNPELVDLSAFAMIRALYMPRHSSSASMMAPGGELHPDLAGVASAQALPPELAPYVPEAVEHEAEVPHYEEEAATFRPEDGLGEAPSELAHDATPFEHTPGDFDPTDVSPFEHAPGDVDPDHISDFERAQVEFEPPEEVSDFERAQVEFDAQPEAIGDVPEYLRHDPAPDTHVVQEQPAEAHDDHHFGQDLGHEAEPAGGAPSPELAEPVPALDTHGFDAPEPDTGGVDGLDVEPAADPDSLATMYCYIGGLTNLAIAVGTNCVFNRVLQNGVESMAATLAERRGLTLDHAREWIKYVGLERPIDTIEGEEQIIREAREVLENGARRIVDEVRLSIEYYHSTVPNAPRVDAAVMAGPGVTVAGLRSLFEQELGLPVEPRSMGQVEVQPGALDKVDAAHLTIATGLALEEVPA